LNISFRCLVTRVKRESGLKPLQPAATVLEDEIQKTIGKPRRLESKMMLKPVNLPKCSRY